MSTALFVVSGAWKLRHNEVEQLDDCYLALHPLQPACDPAAYTLLIELDELCDRSHGFGIAPNGQRVALEALPEYVRDDSSMPLALAVLDDEHIRLTHACLRVDPERVQFMRLPAAYAKPSDTVLWQQIATFNAEQHLFFANHECYFIKHHDTIELEQKFNFTTNFSYLRNCQRIYDALTGGHFPGFAPKYDDEFQLWSFDNYLYEIIPDERDEAGYVSMLHYCKKKRNWNDPMFMYKKKMYAQDTLERWERNYQNQWVERDKQELLEEFFGYKTSPLPPWRRTRADVPAESVYGGNVFLINLDDCRVFDGRGPHARLQQCEIEYISTHGQPDPQLIYAEFWNLVDQVHTFLSGLGLGPVKTYYSKLTWLRDYCATTPDEAQQ